MNRIEMTHKVAKQLRKLPAQDHRLIISECYKLANMPNCGHVKALVNHLYQYRLRVGDFRVFFNFDGDAHIIFIEEVKRRDEHTY